MPCLAGLALQVRANAGQANCVGVNEMFFVLCPTSVAVPDGAYWPFSAMPYDAQVLVMDIVMLAVWAVKVV